MRASLAPEEPFFRLGIAGVTVPALKIGGEIGQQLGYLAAAGVGTGNFVILVIVGWAFNNRPAISRWRERRKIAREAKAAEGSLAPVGGPLARGIAIGWVIRAEPAPASRCSIAADDAPSRRSQLRADRRPCMPGSGEALPGAPSRFFSTPAGLPRAPWTNAAASLIRPWSSSRSATSSRAHPRGLEQLVGQEEVAPRRTRRGRPGAPLALAAPGAAGRPWRDRPG